MVVNGTLCLCRENSWQYMKICLLAISVWDRFVHLFIVVFAPPRATHTHSHSQCKSSAIQTAPAGSRWNGARLLWQWARAAVCSLGRQMTRIHLLLLLWRWCAEYTHTTFASQPHMIERGWKKWQQWHGDGSWFQPNDVLPKNTSSNHCINTMCKLVECGVCARTSVSAAQLGRVFLSPKPPPLLTLLLHSSEVSRSSWQMLGLSKRKKPLGSYVVLFLLTLFWQRACVRVCLRAVVI